VVPDVEFGGTKKNPWGDEKAGFSFNGKINLKDWGLNWNAALETSGVLALPVTVRHALQVAALPLHHRDPFDRLLIAQAQTEGLHLLTADRQMAAYDVALTWAN